MTLSRPLFAVAVALGLHAGPALAADGARTFQLQCKTCHGAKSSPMGPALGGVSGGKIAGKADFIYSAGLKAKAGTWTDANLDAYLAAPTKFAPGTRMMVAVTKPDDRAAVVAYLKTLK